MKMRIYSVPYIGSTCFSTLVSSAPAKSRRSREFWHHQNPREPVMGIEPMTTVLPRLCATAAPHGPVIFRWAVRDSNPRSRQTADLQSAPFGHFGNCPGKSPPIHQHFLIDRLGYYSRRFVSCQAFNSEAVEETGCF